LSGHHPAIGKYSLWLFLSTLTLPPLTHREPQINPSTTEKWFKETLFPQMSRRLQAELDERSNEPTAGLLSSMADSAKSFLLDKTKSIRSEVAWAAFYSSSFQPSYRDFYFFRTASVNMGTAEAPLFVVFIGINLEWYLSPHIKLDFDSVSVLRMIEN
jgi:hypothetical protein